MTGKPNLHLIHLVNKALHLESDNPFLPAPYQDAASLLLPGTSVSIHLRVQTTQCPTADRVAALPQNAYPTPCLPLGFFSCVTQRSNCSVISGRHLTALTNEPWFLGSSLLTKRKYGQRSLKKGLLHRSTLHSGFFGGLFLFSKSLCAALVSTELSVG